MALGDLYKVKGNLIDIVFFGYFIRRIYVEITINVNDMDFVRLKNDSGHTYAFCRRYEVTKIERGLLIEKWH